MTNGEHPYNNRSCAVPPLQKTTALPHTVIQLLTMCGCWKRICSTKTSDPYVVLTTYRRLHWASDEKLLSQRFQTKPVKEVRAAQ